MTNIPDLGLAGAGTMPQLGFGVWQVPPADTATVVGHALAAGYRSIDTAAVYGNEAGVGEAIRRSGLPRDALFITTKLKNDDHGYDSALRACDTSLQTLGLDSVDLYLIHWPKPSIGLFVDCWRALIRLRDEGKVKAIGVSNFTIPHLERLISETGVTPVINQIELHPRFQQRELRAFAASHGMLIESWSPLGRGRLDDHPIIAALAGKHGKTWAQIVIRWHIQSGLVVIPRTVTPARMTENLTVFDFALSADDMAQIAAIDAADGRIAIDPATT